MAGDKDNKTEQASEKRKADARLEGNIAVSRDVTTAAMQVAGVGLLFFLVRQSRHKCPLRYSFNSKLTRLLRQTFFQLAMCNARGTERFKSSRGRKRAGVAYR